MLKLRAFFFLWRFQRWQSKWEVDMRPDPRDMSIKIKSKTTLRPWKSMPKLSNPKAATKPVPLPKSNLTTPLPSRKGRVTRRFSERRTSISSSFRSSLPLPDIEERIERPERTSVTSYQVDGYKMLYKTDDRTENFLDTTARMWHFEPKKANKTWFLGNTFHTKTETHPSEIVIPRKNKPFTSIIRTVQRQTVRPLPDTIIESIREEKENA